ncbi:MAG TPA: hypothetical protein PLL88_00585 [Anaerolineaceae bacterium]|nr:hypothetical protein [Anaerolineaceae bacterium]
MKKFFSFLLVIALLAAVIYVFLHKGSNALTSPSPIGLDMSAYLENAQDGEQFVDTATTLGVTSVKIAIPWQFVERSAGLFTWSINSQGTQIDLGDLIHKLEREGMSITLVLEGFPSYLQYENLSEENVASLYLESWERYVRASVAEFGDVVDAWQIGESVNLPFELQDQPIAAAVLASPSTYAERLAIASNAIKEASHSDLVILGGIRSDTGNCINQPSAFLNSINTLGMWNAFDVIGVELDTYSIAPEGKYMYQTYDTVSGVCLTSAEGGFTLADIIALVDAAGSQYGEKPIWITGLAWQTEDLAAIAEERGTLVDVVRADLLSRASIMLLGRHNVEKIFWQYAETDSAADNSFGVFSQQVFKNLAASLQGLRSSQDASDIFNGYYQYRMTSAGMVDIFVWRGYGGDDFLAYTLQNVGGYQLEAFSLDADSIRSGKGLELSVSTNGETAFMLSERPVLIKATPTDLKERLALSMQGLLTSAGKTIKNSAEDIVEEQKEKASQELEEWLDEKKESLFAMLKESFMEWLDKILNWEQ